MQTQSTSPEVIAPRGNAEDVEYYNFLGRMNSRFNGLTDGEGAPAPPLFTTDAPGLWDAYLAAFAPSERQYHNCNSCRRFVERFGDLVAITREGFQVPAMWESLIAAPKAETLAIDRLREIVTRANVTGVFLSPLEVWGEPVTGAWRHFSVAPRVQPFKHAVLSAGQAMAETREDFANVSRALAEFSLPQLAQVLALVKGEALDQSERVLGPAQWLHDLQAAIQTVKGPRRANIIWRHVATAPAGFCHPRSSMIGTLLDDLANGMAFAEVSRRFSAKMNPLKYQRPQAPPSAGNIAQAEKIVEKLGAAGALERRFARLDELQTIWLPAPPTLTEKPGGVFGHLKPKETEDLPELKVTKTVITFEKFARTVLPTAQSIEFLVPGHADGFCAIVTAANPEAPPILQWDSVERRNPFSWYLYPNGSPASRWGLIGGRWRKVTAVSLKPSMWFDSNTHHGHGAIFVLDGAVDQDVQGNSIFPATLRSEFHGVRATIEAYSRAAQMLGAEQASACGYMVGQSPGVVRVDTGAGVLAEFLIERWD